MSQPLSWYLCWTVFFSPGKLVHGSASHYSRDPSFLTSPFDVNVSLSDLYRLDIMAKGTNYVFLELGDNCTLHHSDDRNRTMCKNYPLLSVTSAQIFVNWSGCDLCVKAIQYNITIDDEFKKLFEGQSDLKVSFIHSYHGGNTSRNANIHLISDAESTTAPCQCSTCPSVNDASIKQTLPTFILSTNRGSVHFSTWVVTLCAIISVILVCVWQ